MADWDTNSPADNDIVSQYPGNERAARGAVQTNFGVDHHEVDDADVGKHEQATFVDAVVDPTFATGETGIWNNAGKLNTREAGGAVKRVFSGEAGTKCVFFQAAAPTGWTQDIAINDQVLRVVSGAGGGSGGSWVISGLSKGSLSVDGHILSIAEIPPHTHSYKVRPLDAINNSNAAFSAGSNGAFHNESTENKSGVINSTGGGAAHAHGLSGSPGHDGAWRPAYIDVIVASID